MTAEELEAGKDFGRYLDVDGDGIPYRTYPGTHPTKGSYFTRGTTKDAYARYSEEGAGLRRQHGAAAEEVRDRARSSCRSRCARRAQADALRRHLLRLDQPGDGRGARRISRPSGIHVDALRVRAFPFHDAVVRLHRRARPGVRRRAEPRRPAAHAAGQRCAHRSGAARCPCCTTTARRSPRASSPATIAEHSVDAARRSVIVRARPADMTYIAKPKLHHPRCRRTTLGFTRRDYEGAVSTLCAGCGHDSISAAIIQACFELDLPPHRVAKLSGIGCSSKTPTYFLGAVARLQHRARPHAVGADRRQPRQPRPDLSRRVRRRRLAPRSASASSPTSCGAAST